MKPTSPVRSLPAAAVLAGAAVLAVVVPTAAAVAAPGKPLKIAYDVTGSTHLTSTDSTVALGPAVLSVAVKHNGDFTGALPLPPTSASFTALGLLPVTATVSFVPDGPVTGHLTSKPGSTTVSSTATDYVKLSDVAVAGVPAGVGDSCQTVDPVTLTVATPKGKQFNVAKGGKLTGSYDLGKFANCGLTTPIVNAMVPGTGNTITLKLSNGRAAG
jgi:hypothetical protein